MGVGISELVEPVRKVITLKNLSNRVLAIDAYNMLYQFLCAIRGRDGQPLRDNIGITSHLQGLFGKINKLLVENIKPCFVFDGRHPDAKRRPYLAAQKNIYLTPQMVSEAKELLILYGLPYIQAPGEGEAQAAHLCKEHLAWATVTQDYDAFLFGSTRVIRNLTERAKDKSGRVINIEWYSLEKLEEFHGVTRELLVDVAIMIGCDFTTGVKGIGLKTAMKLLAEYGNIEGIIQSGINVRGVDIATVIDMGEVSKVRDIFLKPNVITPPRPKFSKPDFSGVESYLIRRGFNQERIHKAIRNVSSIMSKPKQQKLASWM